MKTYLRRQRRPGLWLLLGTATLTLISCGDDEGGGPTEGAIAVQSQTSGVDFDSDGYLFSVNSGQGQQIGHEQTVYVPALEPGTYEVRLNGIAANCTVPAEANPQEAIVVAGDTVDVVFPISCEPAAPPDDPGGPPQP
jgi:hypothetical protein